MIRLFLTASIAALAIVAIGFMLAPGGAVAGQQMCGVASFYGTESGSVTASGERFNPKALTAAMPSRKHLGERWRVTYGHRSVVVRVNDLGPAKRLHRVVDMSRAAFARLAPLASGTLKVCMERL